MIRRTLVSWAALSPLIVLNLFPFAVMLVIAAPPAGRHGAEWALAGLDWSGFARMWDETGFPVAFGNTLRLALGSATGSVLIAAPAAYALSRYRFRFLRSFENLLLATQMVAPIVLVLGLSQLVIWLGLVNSLNGIALIYGCFQVAFAAWLLHGYFDAIPREIEEAARLDGASRLRVLWSILLPLSLPALAVTTVVSFIAAWNEFALALTFLRNRNNQPLSVQVYGLVAGRYEVDWHQIMAAVFSASLPIILIFAVMHRPLCAAYTAISNDVTPSRGKRRLKAGPDRTA